MSSTLDVRGDIRNKEYQWKEDGIDGFRSYSYNASSPTWNYSTEPDKSNTIIDEEDDGYGAYRFSDSSTGQPFARRGNLYNWTAATLGSGLNLKTDGEKAPDSICPKGWQLPNYSSNTSFKALVDIYDITNNVAGANRISEWSIQYLPTGSYGFSFGYVDSRTTYGYT